MARMNDAMYLARSKIAIHSRRDAKHHDPVKVAAARRELTFLRLEQYVHEKIEVLAPLTTEEHARIVMALMAPVGE